MNLVEHEGKRLFARYGITVPEDDYMKLSSLDSSVAYLEPLIKDT